MDNTCELTAGVVGYPGYTKNVIISDIIIKDTDIIANSCNVAGILALSYYNDSLVMNNCDLENCNIKLINKVSASNSNTCTGGLIGYLTSYYNSSAITHTISNCNIKDSNIYGVGSNTAGGIGFISSSSALNILNCSVENTDITENYNSEYNR